MKKLIILDLDETLIYADKKPLQVDCSFMVEGYYVYRRPYLTEFLQFCADTFRVAIWTASNELYAKAVVSEIFSDDNSLEFVWSRKRCTIKPDPVEQEYIYIKNLKKIKAKGYDLNQVIFIDDDFQKLSRNYGNLVLIKKFEGCQDDRELYFLKEYLKELNKHDDIRNIDKRGWRRKYHSDKVNNIQ